MIETLIFSTGKEVQDLLTRASSVAKIVPLTFTCAEKPEAISDLLKTKTFEFFCIDSIASDDVLNMVLSLANKNREIRKTARTVTALFGPHNGAAIIKKHVAKFFINDYVQMPGENNYVAKKLLLFFSPNWPSDPSIGWTPLATTQESMQVTLFAKAEQVSEFGINIATPKAFQTGEFVWVHLPAIDEAGGETLLARCYKITPKQDKQNFACCFVFVGISDNTLKRVRQWSRREYAKTKNMD